MPPHTLQTPPARAAATLARLRGLCGRAAVVTACLLLVVGLPGLAGCSRTGTTSSSTSSARSSAPPASAAASTSAPSMPPLPPEQEASRRAALATPPPGRPAGMDEQTPEGAIATAEYLLSLLSYASITGDLSEWEARTEDSGCVFCQSVVDDVTELHARGGWEEPWASTVTGSGYADPEQGYHYSRVDLLFDHDAVHRYDGTGAAPTVYSAQAGRMMTFALVYRDGQWVLGEAEVYQEEGQ